MTPEERAAWNERADIAREIGQLRTDKRDLIQMTEYLVTVLNSKRIDPMRAFVTVEKAVALLQRVQR